MRCVVATLSLAYLSCCNAYGQVLLTHQVHEGAKHTYEITQFVTEVKSKDHKEQSDTGLVISIENGRRDTQGRIRQTVTFESLRNNYDLRSANGSQTLTFDSAAGVAKVDPPGDEFRGMGFFLDVFKALLGASYTVAVDKGNQVVMVEGTQEIVNNAPARATKWLGGLGSQIRVERLQAAHKQVSDRFPDKALNVGDTWEKVGIVEVYLVGPMIKLQRRYEYLGTEERGGRPLDKVRWTDTKVAETPAALPGARRPATPELEQTIVESKGLLYFDRRRGIEAESTHFLHIRRKTASDRVVDLKIETSQRLKE